MPKGNKAPKILVLTRREDMMNYSVRWANELGFDAAGAWKDEQCKDLIQGKGPFVFCALGCVFVNDPYWESELTETKALLEQKGIPYAKMPTFGDVRTVLQEAGLLDLEEKLIDQQPVAAIAG